MKRPNATAGISSFWRRRWLGSLAVLLAAVACARSPDAGSTSATNSPELVAIGGGWMGGYARRDARVGALLEGNPGWGHFRDMELFEAIQAFSGSLHASDRVGEGRTYLALGEFFASLDRLFLETESVYLGSKGHDLSPKERGRLGLVALRLGDREVAGRMFAGNVPEGFGLVWALGRAGLHRLAGEGAEAKAALAAAPPPATDEQQVLAEVACYEWGLPWGKASQGPYAQALAGFRRGDLAGGVLSLQMIDFATHAGPGPDLYLYTLLSRAFGALAAAALAPERAPLWAGRARELAGNGTEAWAAYGVAPGAGPAPWVYSPVAGAEEAVELARVARGALAYRDGRRGDGVALWREVLARDPGPLVLATQAAAQVESGASQPLGNPAESARAALRAVTRGAEAVRGTDKEFLPELYKIRTAAVGRWAARTLLALGHSREARDTLEGAHQKSHGYRPDFIHPPAFLADLARVYARDGAYAPAVAVLFDLTEAYPSTRLAYESLKRLYASRSGGEAPPR